MSSDLLSGVAWTVCAEGLDRDRHGHWLTRVELVAALPRFGRRRRKPLILLRAVIRQTDDDRSLARIRINKCLTRDDAAVVLLGVFETMSKYDLSDAPSGMQINLAEWIGKLYDDPAHVANVLTQLCHCVVRLRTSRPRSYMPTRTRIDDDPARPDPPSRFTSIARAWGGPGVGVVEMQVSLLPPDSKGKGAIICLGVNASEVRQIGHAILRLPQFSDTFHHTLQVRLVGDERHQRRYGLALTLAMSAAFLNRPIPPNYLYLGEVDLDRNVRGVSPKHVTELLKAIDAGEIQTPLTVFAPGSVARGLDGGAGLTVIRCDTLADALLGTWPQTVANRRNDTR